MKNLNNTQPAQEKNPLGSLTQKEEEMAHHMLVSLLAAGVLGMLAMVGFMTTILLANIFGAIAGVAGLIACVKAIHYSVLHSQTAQERATLSKSLGRR